MTYLYMLYLEKGDKSEEFTAAIENRKSLLCMSRNNIMRIN